MFRKIKLILILAVFFSAISCGYDYDWMKGDFEGETKLFRSDYNSRSPELIRTGTGRINFPIPFNLRMGSNTPLPDCNLQFTSEREAFTYSLDINRVEYRGESNDGKGCFGAYLIMGEPIEVEIDSAKMRREKDGEVVLNIKFHIRNDDYRQYELEFRGRKKGWF